MKHAIERLHLAVMAARGGEAAGSRTAKLLTEGIAKMAKKVAEEAVEVGLDAVRGEREQVILESADLMYNLVVLWTELGINPTDVWAEMERREQLYGIAEKLAKNKPPGEKPPTEKPPTDKTPSAAA
ncbi:MAG: phosphoribosyl-ATP diphosphatase [Bosea sp. (in: a-proteobacteria)]